MGLFLTGLFIGGAVGFLGAAILSAASNADDSTRPPPCACTHGAPFDEDLSATCWTPPQTREENGGFTTWHETIEGSMCG